MDQLLNSRAEYYGSAVPRVTIAHDTRDTRHTHQSSQLSESEAGGEAVAAEAAALQQLHRGLGAERGEKISAEH